IGDGTGLQSAAIGQPKYLCGVCRTEFDEALEIDYAFVDEFVERKPDGGFKPDYAERRTVEFERLFVRVMRCVIGRDGIDRSVAKAFEYGFEMFAAAKRRGHLCVGVVGGGCQVVIAPGSDKTSDGFVSQRKMMRSYFASDVDAVVL